MALTRTMPPTGRLHWSEPLYLEGVRCTLCESRGGTWTIQNQQFQRAKNTPPVSLLLDGRKCILESIWSGVGPFAMSYLCKSDRGPGHGQLKRGSGWRA